MFIVKATYVAGCRNLLGKRVGATRRGVLNTVYQISRHEEYESTGLSVAP
jgi:hypothetical protein